MSVPVVEEVPQDNHNPVSQRCDKCDARGYMVAEKNILMLVFCNHHGMEAWTKLTDQGFVITVIPM